MKIILILLLVVITVDAMALTGRVVRVTDGDTIVILTDKKEQVKVRLTEIDAPERKQEFGTKSRQALLDVCANKTATLKQTSKDRYGRTLARVYCGGVDANSYMVKVGLAWVYDRYVKDKSFYSLQDKAKKKKLGLWADKNPTPPWSYRKKK